MQMIPYNVKCWKLELLGLTSSIPHFVSILIMNLINIDYTLIETECVSPISLSKVHVDRIDFRIAESVITLFISYISLFQCEYRCLCNNQIVYEFHETSLFNDPNPLFVIDKVEIKSYYVKTHYMSNSVVYFDFYGIFPKKKQNAFLCDHSISSIFRLFNDLLTYYKSFNKSLSMIHIPSKFLYYFCSGQSDSFMEKRKQELNSTFQELLHYVFIKNNPILYCFLHPLSRSQSKALLSFTHIYTQFQYPIHLQEFFIAKAFSTHFINIRFSFTTNGEIGISGFYHSPNSSIYDKDPEDLLLLGDLLIYVNQHNICGYTLEELSFLLRTSSLPIDLTFVRRNKVPSFTTDIKNLCKHMTETLSNSN
ncbi:hypothetical protein WA158_003889 [Blastocystis sp. Blastoise]